MEQKKTGSKALIVGVIAAVVILAALLVLVLTQCTGTESADPSTTAAATTTPTIPETYELFWNVDRAEYDGKSEAGMSSRMPESDGYFHIRFFKDGMIQELKAADRKVVNAIDILDLMDLVFDENGIIVDVIPLDELPCQKVAWQFYVQSVGGNLIKLNSAHTFVGMEVLLELPDGFPVYDMTGIEGEIGMAVTPTPKDRVLTIADMEGNVTHMFIYSRSEYMLSKEAECRHCQQMVTWKLWTKTDALPVDGGHYQLQNDIVLKGQMNINADAKVCLDLNGCAVDGKEGQRLYSMHNAGVDLAIMDSSEAQTGILRSHGEMSAQGGIIYVRFGAFYLYGGTLDGSDSVNLNTGAVICINKGAFAYINGGTVKGGTAKYSLNASGKPTNGLGGNIRVIGKLVVNDGLITGGTAVSAITYSNGKAVYSRGYGGNIYVGTGATLEINGGKIANGVAGAAGGNIYIDGTCDMTLNGGVIGGGSLRAPDRNGGNLYVGSKAVLTINGGIIRNGRVYNGGGNLYANGTIVMNGGQIYGGKVIDRATGKEKDSVNNNVFIVNGRFSMYGGKISGGMSISDTSTTDHVRASLVLSAYATIYGAPEGQSNLFLSSSGEKVLIHVGTFRDSAKIGITTNRGVFTKPKDISEMDHFVSDIPGVDVIYYEGAYALGRVGCICGKEIHENGCDGTSLLWTPWTSATSLPRVTGNYFLTGDVTTPSQTSIASGNDVKLDLGGHDVTLKVAASQYDGFRLYRADGNLAITDTTKDPGTLRTIVPEPGTPFTGKIQKETVTDPKTGKETTIYYEGAEAQAEAEKRWANGNFGMLLWARGGTVTIHNGIFDGSNLNGTNEGILAYVTKPSGGSAGKLVVYGGEFLGGKTTASGNITIAAGCSMELYGGSISGGEGLYAGNIYCNGADMVMAGGEVTGGKAATRNILVVNGQLTLSGGYADGGVAIDDRTADDGILTTLLLSGDPKITGASLNLNLTARGDGATVHVGEMKTGAQIGVTSPAGIFTEPCAEGSEAYFTSDVSGADVVYYNGALALGKLNCICGQSEHIAACDKTEHLWMPWDASGGTLPTSTGYWFLTGPVTVQKQSSIPADQKVVLDLNGYTVTNQGERIYSVHEAGSSLTITDNYTPDGSDASRTGGTLKAVNESGNLGGIVLVRSGNSLTLIRGTLDATGYVNGNTTLGGAAILVNDNATFTMYGGTVKGGTTTKGNGGSIFINAKGKMVMHGGTVAGGNADGRSGGNIYINANADMELHGGSITGGSASYGGCIYVGGKLTVNGGSIADGKAQGGGTVFVTETGDLTLKGGKISDGKATASGGAVYVSGTLTVSGGEITGGEATTKGGNVYVVGSMNLSNGTITKGKAKYGGNITVEGLMTMSGGEVTGGYGDPRNIHVVNGELDMSGGSADGGVFIDDRTADDGVATILRLSGDPRITGVTANLKLTTRGDGATVYVGTLKDGARININAPDGVFSEPCSEGSEAYFTSDVSGLEVVYHDGALALGKVGCLCGQTEHLPGCDKAEHIWMPWAAANAGLPTATGYWYLTGKMTLTTTSNLAADQKVVLDLNGQTVTRNDGRAFSVDQAGAELIITDRTAAGMGTIKITGSSSNSGLGIYVRNGNAAFLRGTIDASAATTTNASQGGVAVWVNNSRTFTMYGGTIKGGKTTCNNGGTIEISSGGTMLLYGGTVIGSDAGTQELNGTAINISGSFRMFGGTVEGGTSSGVGGTICIKGSMELRGGTVTGGSTTGNGGNIYITNTGSLLMTGGTVEKGEGKYGQNIFVDGTMTMEGGTVQNGNILVLDGTMKISGGKVLGGLSVDDRSATDNVTTLLTISGTPEIAGITLAARGDSCKLLVGELTVAKPIPISAPAGLFATVQSGVDADKAAASFQNKDAGLRVSRQADGLHMVDSSAVIHCLCGQKPHTPGCDGNEVPWQPWAATNTVLPTTTGYWYLEGGMTLTATANLAADQKVVLDLNGQTVTRNNGRIYSVYNTGASLVVTDSSASGNGTLKATGTAADSGLGIYVRSGNAAWIRGVLDTSAAATTHTSQGGVAIWINNSRTFTLYGGTIKGGVPTKCSNGGTIEVSSGGTMEMYGGTLVGCNAPSNSINGTAINNTGTFKMYGGTVQGGTTKGVGGAVCARGITEIHGGIIIDGTSGNGKSVYGTGAGDVKILGGELGDVNITGKLSLSGTPRIQKLTVAADKLTVGALESDASIAVTGTGVVAKNVETDVSACFTCTTGGWVVVYNAADKTLVAQES